MRCLVKPTTMKIYPTTAKIEMGFILEYGHLVVLTVDASLLTANAACRIMETKTSNTAMSIIRMRDSYKRFVKTWIRFANPWIRFVS